MKIIVNPHKLEIEKSPVNEKEINITKCYFEFSEEITNDYVKEAYFTLKDNTYKQIITNDQCDIPSEVLQEKGQIEIGVVAFLVENEEEIKRYNPSPAYFDTWLGSLKDAENSEPITPTDKEQMEQAIQDMETKIDNLDIDAEKVDKTTTVTITKKDGSTKEVEILDGEDGKNGASFEYNWQGTSLGVKTSEEQDYQYVNLKGDKGDPGAIKMIIVNKLPETGVDDTIYLVPVEDPETGNNYEEYIYVNNNWEKLGGIQVEVDLTDYVKNTDYATGSTSGVIKISSNYSSQLDNDHYLRATNDSYATYQTKHNNSFIGKGTLENVIAGKGLVSNTDYATNSVGGVVKVGGYNLYVTNSGFLQGGTRNYASYVNDGNEFIISKGTLENVITGKDLTTKAYVDGLVGDINSVLDAINGEVI